MIPQPEAAQKLGLSSVLFSVHFSVLLWVEEGGCITLRATPALPTSATSLCVCGGKESILQEEFSISKASCVLALYHESHLQDAACNLVSWFESIRFAGLGSK